MSPIDIYIRRATLGLPRRARLDTAAELRVHLNERASALASQGLDRSEAEHLAVEYMGPIEPVNRQFLGHFFTQRVGWLIAAVLFVGFGAWVVANYVFAPAEVASPRSVIPNDVLPLLGDFASLEVTLPTGARTLSLAIAQGDGELFSFASGFLEGITDLRPNQRNSAAFTMGFPIPTLINVQCEAGSRSLYVSDSSGHVAGCVVLPGDSGSWFHTSQDGLNVIYDTWQPLLVYRSVSNPEPPMVEGNANPGSLDWSATISDPSTWLVLSAFTSRAPLQDVGTRPKPPTGSDVALLYPWLLDSQPR